MSDQEKYQRKYLKLKLRDLQKEAASSQIDKEPDGNGSQQRNRKTKHKKTIKKQIRQIESRLANYGVPGSKSRQKSNKKINREVPSREEARYSFRNANPYKDTGNATIKKTWMSRLRHQRFELTWHNVIFEDGFIKLRLEPRRFAKYPYRQSRASYEMIKPRIIQTNIKPLTVEMVGSRIISIEDLSLLTGVIQYLDIQKEWNLIWEGQGSLGTNLVDVINKMSSKAFSLFYRNKDLTDYLKFLCEQQSENYPIIPVMEYYTRFSAKKIIRDSFLFTAEYDSHLYIIWESTEDGKATYVFKSKRENYENERQRIFDYISTTQTHKRIRLKTGVDDEQSLIKTYATINHSDVNNWVKKLMDIISK